MTPASKGRWIGAGVALLVTAAWLTTCVSVACQTCLPVLVLFGGFVIGLPYGIAAGSVVGRFAGRARERRGLVIAQSMAWALALDTAVCAVLTPVVDDAAWRWRPDVDPLAATLIVLSMAIVIPGAVLLERMTRPHDLVPRAAIR
ncbi:MAG TPA: hypothetical protein VGL61_18305 [Kofleriaceae bacterium]|jgi:MFS family permease